MRPRRLGEKPIEHDAAKLQALMAPQWVDWTPTVTQSGAVAVTVNEAKYALIGKVCHLYAKVTTTAAGTGGNAIIVGGIPAAVAPALVGRVAIGTAFLVDTGTETHSCVVQALSASTVQFRVGANSGAVGVTPNFELASTDELSFMATYRIA